jgi:GT2 family glycosyltransferase
MDENLACPTCGSGENAAAAPRLSVVIPTYDAADDLERCLTALAQEHSIRFEIVVVDDASTDRTRTAVQAFPVRYFRRNQQGGPAAARNWGAIEARGDWLMFLDADVVVRHDTIAKALAHIERDPELTALFGSYDDAPAHPGLVSRFRNLLHHHVHQTGRFAGDIRPASTFWTGCGLIRREVFLAFGGFDHWRFERPAIEDIELGDRLTASGHRIALARDVLCKHLKRWTLRSMIRTDFFQRGLPWSLLMLRSERQANDLNVDRRQKFAALAAAGSCAGLGALPLSPAVGAFLLACGLLCVLSVNRAFFALLRRNGGARLALAGIALMHVYYLVCLTSYATALGVHYGRKLSRTHADFHRSTSADLRGPHLSRHSSGGSSLQEAFVFERTPDLEPNAE